MKKLSFLLTVIIFSVSAFAQKYVAVLEIERHPDIVDEVSRGEAMEITGVIRNEAIRVLPSALYSVMTTETVMAMGDAVLADCAEENCIIAIGRRIDAEYVVRGMIRKFQNMFTLSVEMFETEYGNLVASAPPARSESLTELLDKSAEACEGMYKSFLARTTYTLTTRSDPPAAGSVKREPDLMNYAAGTRVAMTATPAAGYDFVGWSDSSGKQISANTTIQGTMTRNMTFIANFQKTPSLMPAPEQVTAAAVSHQPATPMPAPTAPKSMQFKRIVQISTGSLAVGGIVGGLIANGAASSELDRYKESENPQEIQDARNKFDNNITTRNLLYILGGIGAAGFTVTLFF